jgi:hypothetical protein
MGAGFGLDLRFQVESGPVCVIRCVAERMEKPLTVSFRLLFCLLKTGEAVVPYRV